MHGNMFQHAVEAIGDGHFDVGIWPQRIEGSPFEKINFGPENFQVLESHIWRDVDARGAFPHFGFDVDLSLLAHDRDAVMSIHHKIDLSHFIQYHRWETDLLVEG